MNIPNVITDNAALVIGLARALFIFLVAWGVHVTQAQQDATIGLLAALLPVVSLAFTVLTVSATVPRTPSADAAASKLQTPQPTTDAKP